ncbi:hypothetical protein ACHAPS_007327 [Verticillium nonalfalfae]
MQAPHDETGERMFTIMGTSKANESALFLLYENLEAEKMRRSQAQTSECTEDRHSAGHRYSLSEEQFDFAGLCGTFSLTT